MKEKFFISDLHLGHENILNFFIGEDDDDPTLLRPFDNMMEMHLTIIEGWNARVSDGDMVYVLGDVAWNNNALRLMDMMNGTKTIVKGNHDHLPAITYLRHFKDIVGVKQIEGYWLTHVPMHACAVEQERVKGNVHGHMHDKPAPSYKHMNVCVEQVNYTPVSFDEVRHYFDTAKLQWEANHAEND